MSRDMCYEVILDLILLLVALGRKEYSLDLMWFNRNVICFGPSLLAVGSAVKLT